jgi:hypothetical protein
LRREFSATDVDPSPGVPHANGAAYRRISAQVKTRHSVLAADSHQTHEPLLSLRAATFVFRFESTGDITAFIDIELDHDSK